MRITNYTLLNKIAKGNNSSCYVAHRNDDEQKYCIKLISIDSEGKRLKILKEIEILNKLKENKCHKNIIDLKDYFSFEHDNKEIFCLVTEIYEFNLHQYLKMKGKALNEKECKKISCQLLEAVNFCHQK